MIQNQTKKRKKSLFSLQNKKSDELNGIQTSQDERVDRSCQKYLFEIKGKEIDEGLQGDQEISENSFFREIQNISVDLPQLNSQALNSQSVYQQKCDDTKNSASELDEEEEVDKVELKDSQEAKISTEQIQYNSRFNDSLEPQNTQTLMKNGNSTQNVQSQSFEESVISIQNNIQSFKQKKQVRVQTQLSQFNNDSQSNLKSNKKEGWFPEQLIYEKDQNEIKKMVTMAIKNRAIQNSSNQRKSQQNFERAKNIINNLLNSSMNRMMRVRQHVRNFVYFLKLKQINRKSNELTHDDYIAINDLSIYYKFNKKKKSANFFISKIQQLLKFTSKIPIFMPTDSVRVVWDLFQVFFTFIFLYFYSILMFYAQDEKDSWFIQKFFYYAFFLFIVDILINFNTAYFDKDIIITQRKQIATFYIFSTLFITDCTSLMVLGIKVIGQSTSLVYNPHHSMVTYGFNILIFLKANGMSPKRKRFDYVFTLKENQKHVTKLINQIISVITVAHIASIGWYFIGIQEIAKSDYSWLQKANLLTSPYYEKYIYSIYWAVTTMTTVGYGDIGANNSVEALFITINMILFSCVFAYSINNIGFILQEIEKSSKQLNDNITTIQRYLNRKNVNISLKSRVRHYLSFLAQEQKDRDKEAEDQILSILSNKLRDEVTLEINTKILNQYNIFSQNFSKETLNKIVFKMTEVLVSPNEVIFYDDQIDDQSIYFIQSGIIEIYQQSVQKQNKINVISTLTNNQLFGEIAFFSGLSRSASARSVNLSTLYKIQREDFIDIVKENDEDFERFKMIQEQIIFQEEVIQIQIECYTCKQLGHISSQCPRTHQNFDKQFIILKTNFSLFQERLRFPLRNQNRAKFTNFQLIKDNKTICTKIQENLQDLNTDFFNMFDTNESTNGLDYLEDEEEEDDDDDVEYDQYSDQISQKSSHYSSSEKSAKQNKSSLKNPDQKKKSIKVLKKQQNNETCDQCSLNQDMFSRNQTMSNINIDKEESKKCSKQNFNSSNRIKSNDMSEGCIQDNSYSDLGGNQNGFLHGDPFNNCNNVNMNSSITARHSNSNISINIKSSQPNSNSNNYNNNTNFNSSNNNNLQKKRDSESINSNIQEKQQQDQDGSDEEIKQFKKKKDKKLVKKGRKESRQFQPQKQDLDQLIDLNPAKQKLLQQYVSAFSNNNSNFNNNQLSNSSIKKKMYAYAINKCSNIEDKKLNNFYSMKSNIDQLSPRQKMPDRRSLAANQQQSAKSINASRKQLFSQNSTRTINLDHNDFRYSIDNMLLMQGLLSQTIINATRQSILDQRLSKPSIGTCSRMTEMLEKNYNKQQSKNQISQIGRERAISTNSKKSAQMAKDQLEERSSNNLTILQPTSNTQCNSTNFQTNLLPILDQSENQGTQKQNQHLSVQSEMAERFSNMLFGNQIPLFLQQYQAGMSFRQMQTMNTQGAILQIDQFDKMQNFKKFFPHNNFEKVVNKIKSKLLAQKKLKKQKIMQKCRRQNIVFPHQQTQVSVFRANSGIIKLIPQDYNPDLYKPTYLSYGVGMKKEIFPINNFYLKGFD